MSKFFTTLFLLLLSATVVFSQHWEYAGPFPNADFKGNSAGHGIAVDPDGKIWFQFFGATDSIETAPGVKRATRVLHVLNPDGTPASFSPIKVITVNGDADTLFNSARGLATDHEGNILAAHFDTIYRVNYKTGEGMNKVVPQVNPTGTQGGTESLTQVAVDTLGNIFTRQVFPDYPIRIFDKDFNLIGVAVDSARGFSRSIAVSPDGNTIYDTGYTTHVVTVYTRTDEFSPFVASDSILYGFDSESLGFNPWTKYLWASAGSYNDLPNRFPGVTTTWSPNTWYGYSRTTGEVVDSLKWQFNTPANVNERPRGIAFSPDGKTAYVTCFGASTYPAVQKFVFVGGDVKSNFAYDSNFPDDNFKGNSAGHGIAVDPDGKIWFQFFGATDSIVTAAGVKRATRVLHVLNPNGTPASFSPIKVITVSGDADTLFNSARGLATDHEGNILAAHFDTIYRVNYKTGEGMNKVVPQVNPTGTQGGTESLTQVAVDALGNIFTRQVFPDYPIRIFDKDFNLIGVAVDSARGFSRSIAVSADGNTIYDTGYTTHVVTVYTRTDEFSPFTATGSILKGFDSESLLYQTATGYLWASAGSYNDLPNRFPGVVSDWKPNSWYAYDVANKKVVDRIDWQFNTPNNVNERPRGIAFSPDGKTAYVTCFGASTYPAVQKFVKAGVGVDDKESNWVHVETFQLFQNYPNPFNPQTTIPFDLKNPGQVQVKVFDMMGREVATLVDRVMPAGSHNLVFDAKGLATGTYYYRLVFGGQMLTKRMLFVK